MLTEHTVKSGAALGSGKGIAAPGASSRMMAQEPWSGGNEPSLQFTREGRGHRCWRDFGKHAGILGNEVGCSGAIKWQLVRVLLVVRLTVGTHTLSQCATPVVHAAVVAPSTQ